MNIDKAKQSFQQWANTHYLLSELSWTIEEGEYSEPEMQYAWEAWQASRQSLVIELPKKYESDYGAGIYQDDDGDLYLADKVVTAIEAAGIKVK